MPKSKPKSRPKFRPKTPPAPAEAVPLHVVILAAGQGTRMKSALPKVMHPIGGRPMLAHVLDTAFALDAAACHIVHGHGAEVVRGWCEKSYPDGARVRWVLQSEQLGTAHAVRQALPQIPDEAIVLVLYGDIPLIRHETLRGLLDAARKGAALLTVELDQPRGYGRILRDRRGAVTGIVEESDASPKQRAIREVNTGFMAAPAGKLKSWIGRIRNQNAKREFYLTDCVALAAKDRVRITPVAASSVQEVLGVNDRAQLADQERAWQRARAEKLMREGLHLADPARFDLRGTLKHGRDCSLDVGVVIEGDVELGDEVTIGPYVILRNARLGAGTKVDAHSVLDFVDAGSNCRIGPFARIRPETKLGDDVHVGNFVELKKSTLGKGAKANHLAYVGDTEVGARTNIGAGTITCNYDGANKHKTILGEDVFVGSDTQFVAPVTVGDGATIGAGSTITRDVPAGGLTLCRAREQRSYAGWERPKKKK